MTAADVPLGACTVLYRRWPHCSSHVFGPHRRRVGPCGPSQRSSLKAKPLLTKGKPPTGTDRHRQPSTAHLQPPTLFAQYLRSLAASVPISMHYTSRTLCEREKAGVLGTGLSPFCYGPLLSPMGPYRQGRSIYHPCEWQVGNTDTHGSQ